MVPEGCPGRPPAQDRQIGISGTGHCAGPQLIQAWAGCAGRHAGGVPPAFDPKPILLTGRHVRLEPLERRHLPALVAAAQDPATFQYFVTPPLGVEGEMTKWMDTILKGQ